MSGKPIVPKPNRRTRTATTSRTGDAAWKRAEREVARYFGTERVGLGRAGHDLQEVPTVSSWLNLRAPELRCPLEHTEKADYIFADSKCHKTLLPTLERWHAVAQANPDRKFLKPIMVLGDSQDPLTDLVVFCRLEDFPFVYRSLISPIGNLTNGLSEILSNYWIIRHPSAPVQVITDAIAQAKEAGRVWGSSNGREISVDRILPVAYLYYPKRITPALAFSIKNIASW